MVQRLRLQASIAEGTGFISGQGLRFCILCGVAKKGGGSGGYFAKVLL